MTDLSDFQAQLAAAFKQRDDEINRLRAENARLRAQLERARRPAPATPESEREAMAQERPGRTGW